MAQGTVIPSPKFVGLDTNGNPLAGGKLTVTLAGTSTPVNTYSDVGLTTPNANPVILDSSGRATIFLTPGVAYKFALTDSNNGAIWTQDNVLGTPVTANVASVTGTAGETLAAGHAVYLSDGSGGKNAGQWYNADTTNTYSSTLPAVGMVVNAITSGTSGTITLGGSITGLTSLSVGSDYYISTTGTITTSAPTNARHLGWADTTSSLVLVPQQGHVFGAPTLTNPTVTTGTFTSPTIATSIISSTALLNQVCQGRLTLTSGQAVIDSVSGATTIYFTPYLGSHISLYDGSANWTTIKFAETSLALGTLTSGLPYDVFGFNNSGTLNLEMLAWSSTTARATNIVLQDGIYVKSGVTTRRYLGTFYTTGTTTTEDSPSKRLVWNCYNRVLRRLVVAEGTASWTYTTATWRQGNGSTANQLAIMSGLAEDGIDVTLKAHGSNSTGGTNFGIAIGLDSTTTPAQNSATDNAGTPSAGVMTTIVARFADAPELGYHTYVWLESSSAVGTTTWTGSSSSAAGSVAAVGSGLWALWRS